MNFQPKHLSFVVLLYAVVLFSGASGQGNGGSIQTIIDCGTVPPITDPGYDDWWEYCSQTTATTTGGTSSSTAGTNSTTAGTNSSTAGTNSTTAGTNSTTAGTNSTTAGTNSTTAGTNSTTAGTNATTAGTNSTTAGGIEPDPDPPVPGVTASCSQLGDGRILSWTAEGIGFNIGVGDEGADLTVNKIEFRILKVEPPSTSPVVVCDWTEWTGFTTGDTKSNMARGLRLDSTEFKDQTVLKFGIRVSFTFNGSPYTKEATELSGLVSNKVSLHATQHASNPFFTSGIDYSNATQAAAQTILPVLQTGSKHTVMAMGPGYSLLKANIDSNLRNKNVASLFALTHGLKDGFWDSSACGEICHEPNHQNYMRAKTEWLVSADSTVRPDGVSIAAATETRNSLDPLNLMVLYACDTLKDNTQLMLSNGPLNVSGAAPPPSRDKAVMGYEGILNMYVVAPGVDLNNEYTSPTMLGVHANALCNSLSGGSSISAALSFASTQYSPTKLTFSAPVSYPYGGKIYYFSSLTGWERQDFKIIGDANTRMRGLYIYDLTGVGRINKPATDNWLFIYSGRI